MPKVGADDLHAVPAHAGGRRLERRRELLDLSDLGQLDPTLERVAVGT